MIFLVLVCPSSTLLIVCTHLSRRIHDFRHQNRSLGLVAFLIFALFLLGLRQIYNTINHIYDIYIYTYIKKHTKLSVFGLRHRTVPFNSQHISYLTQCFLQCVSHTCTEVVYLYLLSVVVEFVCMITLCSAKKKFCVWVEAIGQKLDQVEVWVVLKLRRFCTFNAMNRETVTWNKQIMKEKPGVIHTSSVSL